MAGGALVYLTAWRDRETFVVFVYTTPSNRHGRAWNYLAVPDIAIQVEAVERFGVPIINASDRNELYDLFHCAPLGPGA
jgi:hypothetical protein